MELYLLSCGPCRSGDPSLSAHDILRWHREIPQWEVNQEDEMKRLERIFTFKDFAEAMKFTIKVATLAEKEKHHPRMIIEYAKVTLHFWTHKVRGLHLNDFIMAAKVDQIHQSLKASAYHYVQ